MKKRILIVEDDNSLADMLKENFVFSGFDVETVSEAGGVPAKLHGFRPDIVLLDLMLGGDDGFKLCGVIRKVDRTPVIILTALDSKTDKLRGLELGADDYVTKPFDFDELRARVLAVLRRARPLVAIMRLGPTTIDFESLRATAAGRPLHLTRREFDVLHYLVERVGRPVSRGELLREVWGYPDEPETRSVDYAIARLRRKLEPDPRDPRYIHTVHGDGYCLTLDEESTLLDRDAKT